MIFAVAGSDKYRLVDELGFDAAADAKAEGRKKSRSYRAKLVLLVDTET